MECSFRCSVHFGSRRRRREGQDKRGPAHRSRTNRKRSVVNFDILESHTRRVCERM